MDDMARVSEAVTKAVVCALKGAPSDDNTDDWLNPTEVTNWYCDVNYTGANKQEVLQCATLLV